MNLSVSDLGVQGQTVAFVQLFEAPTLPHPPTRSTASPPHWPWVRLGQMSLLVGSPRRSESDPRAPWGSKARRGSSSPSEGRGGERGWCRSQKSLSHSRPALCTDGQSALKVRDRCSQLTLSRDAKFRQPQDSKAVPGPSAPSRLQAATLQARCSRA